ncbi:uncharacterized protein SPSC_04308 [Sporisorium scitamineum]|uniref:Velvet domain-containing protein n=1 Tax=Sporisorium scitamineum TaxID=49012 RepID=A0A0F7S5S4_9BASI|nr:uncharacterized protein SPSC_04308 [Sporisorium scitamineum]CDW97711.1 hypothetical protein [Sporisorium scitamineum]
MDDDRYYDRGSLRFPARSGQDHASSLPRHDRKYAFSSQHERSYPAGQYRDGYSSQQQQGHQPRLMEPDWGFGTGPSRSPPSAYDAPGPSKRRSSQQMSYRPRVDGASTTMPSASASSLPYRSEWLVLPSVSHALGMYGNKRRQEPRFSLVIRQQPRRGLTIGNSQMSLCSARSVPIDPPPACELLIDHSGDEQLLSLPEVFIRAQLVRGDSPMDECLPDARRIEPLVGDTLQSPFNSRIDTREDQSFFVFTELGVRNRGVYRLRFDLFDRVGLRIFKIASVYSDAFEVQERRKHPGLSASSALMDALVDRGMKYKLRKANDKQNPKKRKSPEDFYYGDERSITAARRQSYAAGEFDNRDYASRSPYGDAPQQLVRSIPHCAQSGERVVTLADDRRDHAEMLPPPRRRLSPTFRTGGVGGEKIPQLPSLARLSAGPSQSPRFYPGPQLHLLSSHLPQQPQLHSSRSAWTAQQQQDDEQHLPSQGHGQYHAAGAGTNSNNGRTLSPLTADNVDRQRPSLDFRSSSSSVVTSNSTGREGFEGFTSTPSSSTTEGTPLMFNGSERPSSSSAFGLGLLNKPSDADCSAPAVATPNSHRGSISKLPSPSSSNGNRPTLPPISSLYAAQPSTGRRPSAALTHQESSYFGSISPRTGH